MCSAALNGPLRMVSECRNRSSHCRHSYLLYPTRHMLCTTKIFTANGMRQKSADRGIAAKARSVNVLIVLKPRSENAVRNWHHLNQLNGRNGELSCNAVTFLPQAQTMLRKPGRKIQGGLCTAIGQFELPQISRLCEYTVFRETPN